MSTSYALSVDNRLVDLGGKRTCDDAASVDSNIHTHPDEHRAEVGDLRFVHVTFDVHDSRCERGGHHKIGGAEDPAAHWATHEGVASRAREASTCTRLALTVTMQPRAARPFRCRSMGCRLMTQPPGSPPPGGTGRRASRGDRPKCTSCR